MSNNLENVWLSSPQFAELTGITQNKASRILTAAFLHGVSWEGSQLNVRQVTYRGRPAYRVLKTSLPAKYLHTNNHVLSVVIDNDPILITPPKAKSVAEPATPEAFTDLSNWSGDWVTIKQTFPNSFGLPNVHAGFVIKSNADGTCLVSSLEGTEYEDVVGAFGHASVPTFRARRNTMVALQSKDIESATAKFLHLSGSYDTSVVIRAYDNTLEFSGNPSRFDRSNNIFGYSVVEMINVINTKILPLVPSLVEHTYLPLPVWARFTVGERLTVAGERTIRLSDYDGDKAAYVRACKAHESYLMGNSNVIKPYTLERKEFNRYTEYVWREITYSGASFSRIDLNLNIAFGHMASSDAYLAHCARVSLGRLSPRLDNRSVYWGGKNASANGYWKFKAYCKLREFVAHASKEFAETEEYQQIYDYLVNEALVRIEMTAFREFLRQHGMLYLGNFVDDYKQEELTQLVLERISPLLRTDLETIDMSMLSRVEQAIYADWSEGKHIPSYMDVLNASGKPLLAPRTYYRIRKGIKEKLGIDVAYRRDIANEERPPQTTKLLFMRPATRKEFLEPPVIQQEKLRIVR